MVYTAVALALHEFFPAPLSLCGPRTLGWIALVKLCIQARAGTGNFTRGMHVQGVGYPMRSPLLPNPLGAPAAACLPACLPVARPHHPLHTSMPLQETLDKTHYSVDMFLAVVLTFLVWKWREHVYQADDTWQPRPAGAPADPVPRCLVALVVVTLIILFVGVAGT